MDSIKRYNVECDSCKEVFTYESIHIENLKLTGVSVSFFRCPHCGQTYPVKYTDKKQKELDAQIAGYAEMIRLKKKKGKSISAVKLKKLDTLMEFSKNYQKVLKEKFGEIVTAELAELNKTESGLTETSSIIGKE